MHEELIARIVDWLVGEVASEDGSAYGGEASFEKGVRAGRYECAISLQGMINQWESELWPDRKELEQELILRDHLIEARTLGPEAYLNLLAERQRITEENNDVG